MWHWVFIATGEATTSLSSKLTQPVQNACVCFYVLVAAEDVFVLSNSAEAQRTSLLLPAPSKLLTCMCNKHATTAWVMQGVATRCIDIRSSILVAAAGLDESKAYTCLWQAVAAEWQAASPDGALASADSYGKAALHYHPTSSSASEPHLDVRHQHRCELLVKQQDSCDCVSPYLAELAAWRAQDSELSPMSRPDASSDSSTSSGYWQSRLAPKFGPCHNPNGVLPLPQQPLGALPGLGTISVQPPLHFLQQPPSMPQQSVWAPQLCYTSFQQMPTAPKQCYASPRHLLSNVRNHGSQSTSHQPGRYPQQLLSTPQLSSTGPQHPLGVPKPAIPDPKQPHWAPCQNQAAPLYPNYMLPVKLTSSVSFTTTCRPFNRGYQSCRHSLGTAAERTSGVQAIQLNLGGKGSAFLSSSCNTEQMSRQHHPCPQGMAANRLHTEQGNARPLTMVLQSRS